MANVKSEPITKEAFDALQEEVKALEKAQAKQRELLLNSSSISKGDLKGLKADIIMWVVGIMIAFGVLILIVLNQRIGDVNQRISELREDINANRVMIQKILDKLDD